MGVSRCFDSIKKRLGFGEELVEYTREYYEVAASSYRRRPWNIVCKVEEYSSRIEFVGDIGCGIGSNLDILLNNSRKGVALDYSYRMLVKSSRFFARKKKLHRIILVNADMRKLPFRDSVFDALIYVSSLHHIPYRSNRVNVLKEAYRVLKNNGILVVTVWARYQLKFIPRILANLLIRLLGRIESIGDVIEEKVIQGKTLYRYHHLYTLNELVRDIEYTGFNVLEKGVFYPTRKGLGVASKNYFVVAMKGR